MNSMQNNTSKTPRFVKGREFDVGEEAITQVAEILAKYSDAEFDHLKYCATILAILSNGLYETMCHNESYVYHFERFSLFGFWVSSLKLREDTIMVDFLEGLLSISWLKLYIFHAIADFYNTVNEIDDTDLEDIVKNDLTDLYQEVMIQLMRFYGNKTDNNEIIILSITKQ